MIECEVKNMSKDKTTEEKAKTLTCWRCGRIIWSYGLLKHKV